MSRWSAGTAWKCQSSYYILKKVLLSVALGPVSSSSFKRHDGKGPYCTHIRKSKYVPKWPKFVMTNSNWKAGCGRSWHWQITTYDLQSLSNQPNNSWISLVHLANGLHGWPYIFAPIHWCNRKIDLVSPFVSMWQIITIVVVAILGIAFASFKIRPTWHCGVSMQRDF